MTTTDSIRVSDLLLSKVDVVALEGRILDADGVEGVRFSIPSPRGLDGPLSAPVGVQLEKGSYRIEVVASGHLGREVPLRGALVVEGSGEVRVHLRSAD